MQGVPSDACPEMGWGVLPAPQSSAAGLRGRGCSSCSPIEKHRRGALAPHCVRSGGHRRTWLGQEAAANRAGTGSEDVPLLLWYRRRVGL